MDGPGTHVPGPSASGPGVHGRTSPGQAPRAAPAGGTDQGAGPWHVPWHIPAGKILLPLAPCPDFRQLSESAPSLPVDLFSMSAWLKDETTLQAGGAAAHAVDIFALLRDQTGAQAAQVTAAGAAWLAGASAYPRSTLAQWEECPSSPGVLPCGTQFDVVNVPALFGRRMLERLWAEGPGTGPVAVHRGRMLLFASPVRPSGCPRCWPGRSGGGRRRPPRRGAPAALSRHRRRRHRTAADLRVRWFGAALAGGARHPDPLAAGARCAAVGVCTGEPGGGVPPGGARLGADVPRVRAFDFSSGGSGC